MEDIKISIQTIEQSTNLPEIVPVLPLKNLVSFPAMLVPVAADEPRDMLAIDRAIAGDRILLLVTVREDAGDAQNPENLYEVGCTAVIQKMVQLPDNTRRLVLRSTGRVRIVEFTEHEPVLMARVEQLEDIEQSNAETEAFYHTLLNTFKRIVELSPYLPDEAYVQALSLDNPSNLCDFVASAMPLGVADLQSVLAAADVAERLQIVVRLSGEFLNKLELLEKVGSDARGEMEKSQREYMLRQQMQAIKRELGEEDDGKDLDGLRERLHEAGLSEKAQEAADRELKRLEMMNPASAEYGVARTYLEWMAELPWSKSSKEQIEIDVAQKILDEDHWGLEEVKDRIIEHLAVRKIKADSRGPILCFAGPPGVGKTSLGRSIARATGREFIRMSLGGVHDEAEIRGHRRTYIGALPGRIIRALRDAKTNNPVIMLDEVDKVGQDFRGDPTSALLEVLDPEQNFGFSDHYMEVPFDLSKVLFICTANVLQTIPGPLLDRMEIIQLAGYTEADKLHITKRYLVPKQREENGLKTKHVKISDAAIRGIINRYTREAGVRGLERQIGTVCRKLARMVASGETKLPRVGLDNLSDFLGRQRVFSEVSERVTMPGIVTGLAWTPTGGDILFIEATQMPGKGAFKLTGQLGDVMTESAQAALSYVRANAKRLGVDEDFYKTTDIHIHVPGGAVPKDGPSAGVAMVTSLVSLLTGRRVKPSVGMTGEITLRGKVLPIGGVKEKSLAANRAGLKTVILPRRNEPDAAELNVDLTGDLKFVYADMIDDVLKVALE